MTSLESALACSLNAVEEVVNEEGDDYYVFLLSDANLAQYGVSPKSLADALLADRKVNSYAIFIAGEAEAEAIKRAMPVGHAHTGLDTGDLPKIFKEIFAHSFLNEAFQ